nr:hypothetical protein [Tanacetum cinerariifolium]
MDNKKRIVNLEYFKEMLHICATLPGQTFGELPFEEEILAFLRFLGHSGKIRKLTDVSINKLHQPWRSLVAIINKCLSGKSTGYDVLWLSQAQILWGMYHKKNVYFAYLLWEDFVYQVELKDAKKSNEMYYPRFIKLTNEDIKNSEAYKEYYVVASGAAPLKTKASVRKTKSSFNTTITPLTVAGTRLSTSTKGKQPAKASKAKDEGTGIIPGVLDVPTEESDEEISYKSSDEDDDVEVDERSNDQDDDDDHDDDDQDDDDQDEGDDDDQDTDNDGDEFVHPKLSIHKERETKDEKSFDPIVQTLKNSDDKGNDDACLGLNVGSEEGHDADDDDEKLYRDVNINLEAFSSIPGIVERYMDQRMAEAVKIIKEQVKEQVKVKVSKILPKFEKTMNEQIEAKVLTRSSNSSKTSYAVAADLSKMELKKILIEKIVSNKSIHQSDEQRNLYKAIVDAYESDKIILDTYGEKVTLKRRAAEDQPIAEASQHPEWFQQQKKPSTPDRAWNKTLPAIHKSIQPWINDLAKQADSRSSFNEPMDTLVDFLAFLMNRLKVDTLTPELLAGPTSELMKGSCKSLVELEFFLEEVYKATTDQLDWNNPEGQQYPYNLLKSLPRIPNSRGRHVIPFDHFINNDFEYLRGEFAVNRESARDVYSKHRIIIVTELQIVEWNNYKNLDWITVRRDDDKLYKFKEGDFKRLHIQGIEDMLLLPVQGKLTNIMVEERFTFNVSLRMFTRSIVIQWRVEDLQLGVESYQKKLNLTKPDTYRSDLKHKEAYIAYSNLRGFIYQNKDKQNINPVKEILLKLNLPDHKSILTDSQVTPTKHGPMTKPYSSHRFIVNCFNAGHLKMEVKKKIIKQELLWPSLKDSSKKGTQRFSSAKATDQTECHKYGMKGHCASGCWSKTSAPSYQSPFQSKSLSFSQHKPKLRPTKDLEAKYKKVKAKLALLSSCASAFKASMVKNKGLIAVAYEWDKEEVSLDDNETIEVKVLMDLAKDNVVVSKEGAKMVNRILPAKSQRNTIDPSVVVTGSSATKYDSVDESSVCSTPLPPMKKLNGAELTSGPKTIKSILSSSALVVSSALAGKLKSVKIKDDPSLAIVMKELINLKLQFSKNQSSYSRKSSILEDSKLKKPITSHLMKALMLSNSQNLPLTTSTLLKIKDQNGQTNQNDQTAQTDEIFNDDLSGHSNHNNDEKIIDNLLNTKDVQISKHLSSPNVEDTSVQDTILIPNPHSISGLRTNILS